MYEQREPADTAGVPAATAAAARATAGSTACSPDNAANGTTAGLSRTGAGARPADPAGARADPTWPAAGNAEPVPVRLSVVCPPTPPPATTASPKISSTGFHKALALAVPPLRTCITRNGNFRG